jgi:hypothetical protein
VDSSAAGSRWRARRLDAHLVHERQHVVEAARQQQPAPAELRQLAAAVASQYFLTRTGAT